MITKGKGTGFYLMKIFYQKYKHAVPLIIYGIIYLAWFAHLEKTVTKDFQVIHTFVDDYIPFCEVFVIPYFLWFAYVAVTVLYFFFKDRQDYYKTCAFLFTGMTVFLIISTLFPNGHDLRLSTMPRDNIFTHMVSALWQTDTPTNLWPSIHVYNSLGAHFAITKSVHLENRKGIRIGSLILCVSIILSTMFIKQHSVFDVITGIIMALVMYLLVYHVDVLFAMRRRKSENGSKPQIG